MQIISFPAHYQSVYTNFDISSFSLISCSATEALSASKCGPFAMPKSLNEKIGGLWRVFQDRFPLWLEIFREHTFVKVIPL